MLRHTCQPPDETKYGYLDGFDEALQLAKKDIVVFGGPWSGARVRRSSRARKLTSAGVLEVPRPPILWYSADAVERCNEGRFYSNCIAR